MEKLSDLCSKPGAPGMHIVTVEGLHKWVQTYCKAWMVGFEVGFSCCCTFDLIHL